MPYIHAGWLAVGWHTRALPTLRMRSLHGFRCIRLAMMCSEVDMCGRVCLFHLVFGVECGGCTCEAERSVQG